MIESILDTVGTAILKRPDEPAPDGSAIHELSTRVAAELAAGWQESTSNVDLLAGLQALAGAASEDVARAVSATIDRLAKDRSPAMRDLVSTYLSQLPAAIRRSLRRPSDASGTTVPPALILKKAEDLVPLLPTRMSRFKPGDRPLAGVDWELVELLGAGGFGEVWKAKNVQVDAVPPVALKFCTSAGTKEKLLRHEAAVLGRVMQQGKHPGIVSLQHTYLGSEPPCIEYEFIEGGDLTGLIKEWHQPGKATSPRLVPNANRLMHGLARIIAFAHQLNPPIVHRDLKPANIMLQSGADGKQRLRVTDFGIGGLAASQSLEESRTAAGSQTALLTSSLLGSCTPLYASPQQMLGGGPDPRDDIHALGVIWYQLLTGDVRKGRPSGKAWRDRLVERGMPVLLLDLLQSCIEDDADDRPEHAGKLADELGKLLAPEKGSTVKPPSSTPTTTVRPTAPVLAASLPEPVPASGLAAIAKGAQERQRQAREQASKLAENYDYAGAVLALEALPEHQRDARLYAKCVGDRDRLARLDEQIRTAVHEGQFGDLREKVVQFLALHPTHPEMNQLLSSLPEEREGENSIGIRFVLIPAGTFTMGTPEGEKYRREDEQSHEVELSRRYWMSTYPITQGEYEQVMGQCPSTFSRTGQDAEQVAGADTRRFPVENVTWHDAVEFCRRLSALPQEKKAGRAYRLPTEAEWEFACRARASSPFSHGKSLSSNQANFDGSQPYFAAKGPDLCHPTAVGSYAANEFGLFDMHGNVLEWCSDWYDEIYVAGTQDPQGPPSGQEKVLRGGSWKRAGRDCRSGSRAALPPKEKDGDVGFRVVYDPPSSALQGGKESVVAATLTSAVKTLSGLSGLWGKKKP